MMEMAERPAHRRVKARIITVTSVWQQVLKKTAICLMDGSRFPPEVLTPGASFVMPDMDETLKAKWKIAYTGIYEAGVYYLIQGQSYILGPGRKAQGDSSTYTANVTIYVPQSGYYTFE